MPHLILLANYRPDGQLSMLRFANMLETGVRKAGFRVTRLEPRQRLGGRGPGAKWRGYLDKYLLAPRQLSREIAQAATEREPTLVHICDHSNAPYLTLTNGLPTLITCHDVMAIKSGLGLVPQNRPRLTGRIQQRWIFRHLKDAPCVACISEKTRHDLRTLSGLPDARLPVIANGLPYPFQRLSDDAAPVSPDGLRAPYYLHVGSDAWYKNRSAVLALYRQLLREQPTASLVFVGPESEDLSRTIREHHLQARVHFFNDLSNEQLAGLYSQAECLLFPSWEEGFGWPPIEAQACGCPVVILDREPMSSISGKASIRLPSTPIQPERMDKWAKASAPMISAALRNRDELSHLGVANARHFSPERMIGDYVELYRRLLATPSHTSA